MARNIIIKTKTELPTITLSSTGFGEDLFLFVSSNSELIFKKISGSGITQVKTSALSLIVSSPRSVITTSSLGNISLGLSVSAGTGNRNELTILGLSNDDLMITLSATTSSIRIGRRNFQSIGFDGIVSDPIPTIFSTSRSVFLSDDSNVFTFSRSGAFGSNTYIILGNITNNTSRIVLPYNCRIIAATGHISSNATSNKHISIIIDETEITSALTFPVSAGSTSIVNTNLNLTVSAGNGIRLIVRGGGGNISNPIINLWYKLLSP
jgi:hypothetical protein